MSLLVPNNKPLDMQIKIAESALTEAFALDLVTMEELEKRLYRVQGANSNSEIGREKKQTTILSSNLLSGAKLRRKRISAKIVLGEQTLDYSKTILEPGKYFINLTTVLGNIKIIVPSEYAVTSEISYILSEVKDKINKEPDANTPEIIITGRAILSSVTIKEKKQRIH